MLIMDRVLKHYVALCYFGCTIRSPWKERYSCSWDPGFESYFGGKMF